METLICNQYGLKINAQYLADKFSKEYIIASKELVKEVANNCIFDSIQREKGQLVKVFFKETLVYAFFKDNENYLEFTNVLEINDYVDINIAVLEIEEYLNEK